MRRAIGHLVGFSVVALGLALSTSAQGQAVPTQETTARAQAAQQFKDGSTAFDRGDFVRAAEAFEAAYGLVPHVDALWNAARANQRANDLPHAANLYARYLREAPVDARDRNVAEAQLASLAAKLGCIEVHGNGIEQISVDEHPTADRIVYVTSGAHLVRAVVAGKLVQQTAVLSPGQVVSLVFEAPTPPVSGPEPPAAPHLRPLAVTPTGSLSAEHHRLSPWVVAGGGALTAVATAAAVASGVSTISALHTFDAHPTTANLATGQSLQARTNLFVGTSIGLGLMTAVTAVWLVDWHGASQKEARVGVGAGRVVVEGRF